MYADRGQSGGCVQCHAAVRHSFSYSAGPCHPRSSHHSARGVIPAWCQAVACEAGLYHPRNLGMWTLQGASMIKGTTCLVWRRAAQYFCSDAGDHYFGSDDVQKLGVAKLPRGHSPLTVLQAWCLRCSCCWWCTAMLHVRLAACHVHRRMGYLWESSRCTDHALTAGRSGNGCSCEHTATLKAWKGEACVRSCEGQGSLLTQAWTCYYSMQCAFPNTSASKAGVVVFLNRPQHIWD